MAIACAMNIIPANGAKKESAKMTAPTKASVTLVLDAPAIPDLRVKTAASRSALISAQLLMELALRQDVFAIKDLLGKTAPCKLAPMTVMEMESAILKAESANAMMDTWDLIAGIKFALIIVMDEENAKMEFASVIKDSMELDAK